MSILLNKSVIKNLIKKNYRFTDFAVKNFTSINPLESQHQVIHEPPRKRVTSISKHFKSVPVKNYKINYVKVGNGPHAVFCFPGVVGAMNSHLEPLINQFEIDGDKFTFYAWDQPGFGLSRPPERQLNAHSMDEDAHLLLELIKTKQAIDHEKFSVMGWSGGGCSALKFAINHPNLVNKLLVWGAFAFVDKEDADNYAWFRDINSWGGKMKETLLEEYDAPFLIKYWADWMDSFCDIYKHRNGDFCMKELHKISSPTLIIHGTKDNIVYPKHGDFLRKHITNSELHVWDKGKHNLQLRYPKEFYSVVKEFLLR